MYWELQIEMRLKNKEHKNNYQQDVENRKVKLSSLDFFSTLIYLTS